MAGLKELLNSRVNRRNLLKAGVVMAGLSALSSIAPEKKVAAESGLPTQLPTTVDYQLRSSVGVENHNGSTTLHHVLKQGDIIEVQAQKMEVAGMQIDVHPEQNPARTAVATIIAGQDIQDISIKLADGTSAWTTVEHTSKTDHDGMINDAMQAGLLEVNHSRNPGNCTPNGCDQTRFVEVLGHNDSNGKTTYDLVIDQTFTR